MYFIVLGQFLRAAEGIDQFAIYLFSGLTLFTFFSDMVFGSTGSIIGNAGLVKKIYLPARDLPSRQHRRRGVHVPGAARRADRRPRSCSRRCPNRS